MSIYRLGVLGLLFFVLIGLVYTATGPSMSTLGVVSPGFEGAKCYFYGVNFPGGSWSGYSGTDVVHRYQDAAPYLIQLKTSEGAATRTNTVSWTSLATPNDGGLGYESRKTYLGGGGDEVSHKPDLGIHVESSVQLQDITRQGDPLKWNESDPMSGRRIDVWNKQLVKTVDTTEKVVYTYTFTKESFLLVPGEFWVGFYLVPSQSETGGTGSGWREGEWTNLLTWFRLDFTLWDNAYKDAWADDAEKNVFDSEFNGTVTSTERMYEYRGGFPIAGWIQGWQKAGVENMDWESGPVSNPTLSDSVWLQTRGKTNIVSALAENPDLKDILMSKCRFAPSLVGQTLMLYDAPESSFTYELPSGATDASTNLVKTPDTRMKKVMYFPVNIQNFGTYASGSWFDGFKVYYPSVYFRVRMIYGVYGNFTYLWTEEVTKPTSEGGLDFPDEVETHGTYVITTPGILEQLGGLSWVILAAIVIVIGLIALFLIGPYIGMGGIMILQRVMRLCPAGSSRPDLTCTLGASRG